MAVTKDRAMKHPHHQHRADGDRNPLRSRQTKRAPTLLIAAQELDGETAESIDAEDD